MCSNMTIPYFSLFYRYPCRWIIRLLLFLCRHHATRTIFHTAPKAGASSSAPAMASRRSLEPSATTIPTVVAPLVKCFQRSKESGLIRDVNKRSVPFRYYFGTRNPTLYMLMYSGSQLFGNLLSLAIVVLIKWLLCGEL
jgi:hypothetical protein